jgi:hypothetical protein
MNQVSSPKGSYGRIDNSEGEDTRFVLGHLPVEGAREITSIHEIERRS